MTKPTVDLTTRLAAPSDTPEADTPSPSEAGSDLTVEIRVNGESRQVPEGSTVLDLLQRVDRHPRTVAVELNGDILRREHYGAQPFQAGDQVEIVHFVQGG